MLLTIQHDTVYDYEYPVETAHHTAHLQPRSTACQKVTSFELKLHPKPVHMRQALDAFGNPQAWWSYAQAHRQLRVSAHSRIHTHASLALNSEQSWEAVREHFLYRSGQGADTQSQLVFATHHAPVHAEFSAYASSCFTPKRTLQEAAVALMRQIHRDFKYASQSTDIHTPALTALQTRKGVCQDFAHVLIACLRSLGLSARYVSGYLLTRPREGQPRLVGADASHAWASVYVPELADSACGGWLDLDPTNNRWGFGTPGEDFVTVAWGRDFADVSPLRGVLQGGQSHTLKVAVSVTPVEVAEAVEVAQASSGKAKT